MGMLASAGAAAGSVFGLAWLFMFVLAILWLLVPFAVFGIKGLLRQLLAEQRRTNQLLSQIAAGEHGAEVSTVHIPEFKQHGRLFGR